MRSFTIAHLLLPYVFDIQSLSRKEERKTMIRKLFSLLLFAVLGVAALAVPSSKALALESPMLQARYQGGDRVYVWWTPVSDATYQLFYGPKDNPWAHGVVLGLGTNYTVGGLFRNTSYAFTVKALRGGDISGSSNTVWVFVSGLGRSTALTAPAQPVGASDRGFMNLRATPGSTAGTVTLYWNEPAGGARNYNVVYTDDSSMEKWGATNLSNSLRSFTVHGLVSGQTYWFWMSTETSGMTPWVSAVAQ